ncbi:MAG: glycosyltransferase family 4 protein [Methanobacterium sp.]|nr:glycosyltransferase family 4 protein [Methanobacterium sp.]
MTRILFIHNTVMWYRIPFFKALTDIYSVKFIFNHGKVSNKLYGVDTPEEIEGLQGVEYEVLSNHLGIAWGLVQRAWEDYDLLVGGSWDSIPEIVESAYYLTVAWLRRKPIVLWREDWAWDDPSLKSRLLKPLKKFMIKISSAIVLPGTKHREYFLSLGSNPEKIFLMPNVSNQTIQKEDYNKTAQLKEKMNLKNKKIVLYVGRLIKRKGIQYLLSALSQLENEDLVLLIVGSGEYETELKSRVQELGLADKVIFTGNIPQENLVFYYLMSDLVVVPSITYGIGDPWVLVLNEAMYFKKPVIATEAVGAACDMIKDNENGFIVPEKDADALAQSMVKILEDNDLKLEMGQKSYEIIQNKFRYHNMVNGFKQAVEYSLNKE